MPHLIGTAGRVGHKISWHIHTWHSYSAFDAGSSVFKLRSGEANTTRIQKIVAPGCEWDSLIGEPNVQMPSCLLTIILKYKTHTSSINRSAPI